MTDHKTRKIVRRWFNNISISRKLYFTVGIMAALIIFELAVLVFSIDTLSSVRAYVGGEGLWSKAQKDAVYQLLKYARTHDEADYRKFYAFMKVPMGDHKSLQEMSKPHPDKAIALQGFIEGRNHPGDVEGMLRLFSRFHDVSYINKAISVWAEADRLASTFPTAAEQLHAQISAPYVSQQRIDLVLARLDPVYARLTVLEDEFSYTLGEGSRWLEHLVLSLLFAVALTVECTGLILAALVSNNIRKGLDEILVSAQAVGRGDFNHKAHVFSADEIGTLASSFNHMSDELQRTLQELSQAEEKFREFMELAPDALMLLDKQGTIQLVNRQCEQIFGHKKEMLVGRKAALLIAGKAQQEYAGRFSECVNRMNPRTPTTIELICLRSNGREFPAEVSLSPIRGRNGTMVAAAVHDISDRKYIRELEHKNSELEQFAYISSHDLQEPLSTIISFITLLEADYGCELPEEVVNYVRYIRESSQRMTGLISDLLEYSKIGRPGEVQRIDCNEVIRQVMDDMHAKIEACQAHIHIDELPVLNGYNPELRLLFQNLLSNALKFRKHNHMPLVKISARDISRYFHFTVEDNGIGIHPDQQEKIFALFHRLHNRQQYEGSGIGLAHCRKIVEMHGGRIWVESGEGLGSRFHFMVPKAESAVPA